MKVFIFLTLIAFSSAATNEPLVRDTESVINELFSLQDQTFAAATADIFSGIEHIVNVLSVAGTTTHKELRKILEQGVAIAHDFVYDLTAAIKNNGDVKAQAKSSIESIKSHVVNQFGVFEKRAVRDAGDKGEEIQNYIKKMIPQCLKHLDPLFKRMQQLSQ